MICNIACPPKHPFLVSAIHVSLYLTKCVTEVMRRSLFLIFLMATKCLPTSRCAPGEIEDAVM